MARQMRKQSNILFIQILFLGTFLIGFATIGASLVARTAANSLGQLISTQAQRACGCAINISPWSYISFSGLLLTLATTGFVILLIGIIKTGTAYIKTARFIKKHHSGIGPISPKLALAAQHSGTSDMVQEIKNSQSFVFCYGVFSPRIYISSTIVHALTPRELKAVLLHEKHHIQTREPARFLFLKLLTGFSIIPGIKKLTSTYLSFAEIAADELATDNFTQKSFLASAMDKILELEEKKAIRTELALAFFSQITEERIQALSDSKYQPSFAPEIIRAGSGIAGFAIILLLIFFTAKTQQAKALALPTTGTCSNTAYIQQCKIEQTKCIINSIFSEEKNACGKSTAQLFSSR